MTVACSAQDAPQGSLHSQVDGLMAKHCGPCAAKLYTKGKLEEVLARSYFMTLTSVEAVSATTSGAAAARKLCLLATQPLWSCGELVDACEGVHLLRVYFRGQ